MTILDSSERPPGAPARLRLVWRIARVAAGAALLGVGALLLILPGPGVPLVLAGLVLLEWDCAWARRLRREISPYVQRWTGSSLSPSTM